MLLVKSVTILSSFLALPALAGFHARVLPSPGADPDAAPPRALEAPLRKASAADLFDVIGFWSQSESFGDFGYRVEFYFGANGSFESRLLVQEETTFGLQAFGTWKSVGDEVRLTFDPKRCLAYGESETVACADVDPDLATASQDTLLLSREGGLRTLLSRGEDGLTPLADYVGPQRAFILPDLFSPTGVRKGPGHRSLRPRDALALPGSAPAGSGFRGARDLLGRDAGTRAPRSPHVPSPAFLGQGR